MRKTLILLILAASDALAEPTTGASYVITFRESQPLVAHVEATLPAGSRALRMTSWGASQMPNGWGSFVSNLTAENATLEAGPNATWTASTDGPLRLKYDVDLSFAKRPWPAGNEQAGYFEDGALFVVSKAIFIVTDAPGEREIAFRLPRTWKIATPWPAVEKSTYRASDLSDLVDNSLVVGLFEPRELTLGDFHVTLALLGETKVSQDIVGEAVKKVLHAFGEVFGSAVSGRYLLTLFAADSTDAEAYVSSAAFTERDPLTARNMIGWGDTVAHELFHSWNGHRLKGSDYATTQWLSEGFTEYFANLALVQEGLISKAMFQNKLEKCLGLYTFFRFSPLFNEVSIADAGKSKGRNRLGVYDAGWAVAFVLDMEIRRATSDRRTLRDFMRLMFARYGTTKTPYTIDNVVAVASEVAGADLNPFFTRYVIGKEMLPIEEALERAGFDVYTPYYNGELYVWPNGVDAVWPAWTR